MTTTTLTPEEILKEINFEERLKEVEVHVSAGLASIPKTGTSCSLAKRNQMRRKLYVESELIRIEIEEKLYENGIGKEMLTSESIKEASQKLDQIRHQLKLEVWPVTRTQEEKAYTILRFATFAILFIGWFSALFLLVPIRFFDVHLRAYGVKKNYLPMEVISTMMAIVITWSAGSTITVEGRENLLNLKDSVVAMFSHASNLDGFLMNAVSPIAFRYAGKKSLFLIPFLGWTSRWGFGYVAIDRRNRKNALKSLKDLASIVNEQGCSIAISPEGTRSTDGLLQDFKKGPFYLREDINKNIAPVIIFGAYELWPPGRLYATPGNTLVRFLPEFIPDPKKCRDLNRLALRRVYLKAFTDDVPDHIGSGADIQGVLKNLLRIYFIWCITWKFSCIAWSVFSWICSVTGLSGWTVLKIFGLISVGLEAYMFSTC